MSVINKLRTTLATALTVALVLATAPAWALGLGQIEVKSQRDQPLLAEIPIISSDPAELEALQARLASPDTFARIGLEPPRGIVSDLQFAVALDARGRPVIRVTSAVPVQQPLLTFLVEVDWGQGRLVREYSALLDTPQTVAAPAQPPIQAPTVAPSNTIVRPPETPVATVPEPTTGPAPEVTPTPETTAAAPAEAAQPAQPMPEVAPVAPTPAPVTSTAAPVPSQTSAPAPSTTTQSEYGPVKRGETLGQIAARLDNGYSVDQTMLALLRANPDAFIGENINLIKQGAVLRMPQPDQITQYSASEAAVVVRDQIEQWREARQPPPQPAAVAGELAADSKPASTGTGDASGATRTAQARLEIVPPAASGAKRAGTRSGVNAGGGGDMLRQELQQTKETLAARDAEVEELKARVSELEKLQQQQQELITLKDSELAAAQQRLATSNQQQQAAAPAAPPTAQTAPASVQPQPAESGSGLLWLGGGLGLVVLGLLAWWWSRRSKQPAPATPRSFNTEALAASIPSIEKPRAPAKPKPETPPIPSAEWNMAPKPAAAASVPAPPPAPEKPAIVAPATVAPTWHSGSNEAAARTTAPVANERIELARAYIDLGDIDTARTLLQEVADGGDAGARDEAARMLRELA